MKNRTLALILALTLILAAAAPAAAAGCPCGVDYNLRGKGVSDDLTSESVPTDAKPEKVPTVEGLEGRTLVGWSLKDPGTLRAGESIQLVDPTADRIRTATVFYAVYSDDMNARNHTPYMIGYPNGNFGPGDNITRGSVATIVARAALTGFVEGSNYGNPGSFTDVSGHWAESAIAYCVMKGAMKGYGDGTFGPDDPITRQEFAAVIGRLAGEETYVSVPFSDAADIDPWARNGIYTCYKHDWVGGYVDGTFKPKNNIRRDEAARIMNGYLGRQVDAAGLSEVSVPDWPDVTLDNSWAYYHIMEASRAHEFVLTGPQNNSLPEKWTKLGK